MRKPLLLFSIFLFSILTATPSFAIKCTIEPATLYVEQGATYEVDIYLDDWNEPWFSALNST